MVISHPLGRLAAETIAGMIRASSAPSDSGNQTAVLPFEIYTRENTYSGSVRGRMAATVTPSVRYIAPDKAILAKHT